MNWRDVVNRLFSPGPEQAASTAELREHKELVAENERHIEAIERHVSVVSHRVRADAERADQRLRRR